MSRFCSLVILIVLLLYVAHTVQCIKQHVTQLSSSSELARKQDELSPLVEGMVKLDGKEYRAVCNCNTGTMSPDEMEFMKSVPVCNPSKVKIHVDRQSTTGLSASEVRGIYGQPGDFIFARVSDHYLSCLDDRISEAAISTPGGDLGEFLLALHVLTTSTSGAKLDEETVTNYLNQYLSATPRSRQFYHCTDDAAVSHVEKSLGIEGLYIAEPSKAQQAGIKGKLKEPENVGDSHLRSVLRDPNWYHVDPELPEVAMKAFYNILWDETNPNRQKMLLDILPGKRDPKALVQVVTTNDCEIADIAPLLKPKTKRASVLISHMSAMHSRRKELADFFCKSAAPSASISAEEFHSRMDRHGLQWLETTAKSVGEDVPIFRLMFE